MSDRPTAGRVAFGGANNATRDNLRSVLLENKAQAARIAELEHCLRRADANLASAQHDRQYWYDQCEGHGGLCDKLLALLSQCLKMMGRVRWMLVDAEAQALPAYDTLAKEVEKVVERSES